MNGGKLRGMPGGHFREERVEGGARRSVLCLEGRERERWRRGAEQKCETSRAAWRGVGRRRGGWRVRGEKG
eukprot:4608879-Pleurochrysis_carterae.AAC.4